MKLVSESLNPIHFERGQDPRKAMDIGMNPLVKNIDSDDLFLLFNITDLATGGIIPLEKFRLHPFYNGMDSYHLREIYERGIKYHELLGPYLKWIGQIDTAAELWKLETENPNKYLYDFTPEGDSLNVVVSDVKLPKADLAELAYDYLETLEKMDEGINFERGKDPKKSMKIGVEQALEDFRGLDLYDVDQGINPETGKFDREYLIRNHHVPEELDLDQLEMLALALDGKWKMGEYFDWKEEEEMDHYLGSKEAAKWEYVYNLDPGGDGWQVLFSNIPLPLEDINY